MNFAVLRDPRRALCTVCTAAMSTFGRYFRVTTFGESHGAAVGAVIDGCPPLLRLCEADIQPQLNRRRPGQSRVTTARKEGDRVAILSGTEGGVTLGTPLSLLVHNYNVKRSDYSNMLGTPRPGHADYTYQVVPRPIRAPAEHQSLTHSARMSASRR